MGLEEGGGCTDLYHEVMGAGAAWTSHARVNAAPTQVLDATRRLLKEGDARGALHALAPNAPPPRPATPTIILHAFHRGRFSIK